ncbi:MAG: DUF2334 domain-containing protein [Polyangiaceae bacterium]|jgi:predicted deacetylase
MMTASLPMPIHVSVHDVSPATSGDVEDALRMCDGYGVRPALLVVPNFHGRAPLLDDGAFCERLRRLQRDGHEIFLHGYFHRSRERFDPASGQGRLKWLFAQRVASGGEAEMSDVSEDEGHSRIAEGERILNEAGLRIDGFVAPGWSMPAWLLPCLSRRGYRFTEDHVRIYDPRARRSRPSVVLNWATRSPTRLLASVGWCRAARGASNWLPARIAIHPGDMRVRLVRSEIHRVLGWAKDSVVASASDLLA